MDDLIIYYLRDGHHTEEHKRRISLSMRRHYAANPMTAEHRQKIAEGMRQYWVFLKLYWQEQGVV